MIYGYDSRTVNEYGLRQMKEVSVSASPEALRGLAAFLVATAEELEGAASGHWHRHIPSSLKKQLECDLIVLNSKPDVEG